MRRTLLRVYIHLVWATHRREPRLDELLAPTVHECLWRRSLELGATPRALGGVEDHVHLLLAMPSTCSLAQLVNELKGTSSHAANRLQPGPVPFRWQGAYAAFSVDEGRLEVVRGYIARQREHHRRQIPGGWELDA